MRSQPIIGDMKIKEFLFMFRNEIFDVKKSMFVVGYLLYKTFGFNFNSTYTYPFQILFQFVHVNSNPLLDVAIS